ncbi:MAG TPA: hypothetical protein VJ914_35420 [Pseudonocardiaceae bacterium]|nr:hypothetical protein [Pseudonocardiaceae bacterium]
MTRIRTGAIALAMAASLTGLAAPAALAAPSTPEFQLNGWHVIGQTSVPDNIAGEGVTTVRAPGKPMWIDYADGATIPASIVNQGWGHIGDPDSWHGYIFDPYQQPAGTTPVTKKMFMVTTPSGAQYEYTHQLSDDEIGPNAAAFDTVTPDGQWMVSAELAPVTRLLVFPTPLLNKQTAPGGGDINVASRILLNHMVRNLQGCDFVSSTRLICASDDSSNDIYPTSKPLLQIDLKHPLGGKDVTAKVTSLGQIPLASTCTGAYTVEGVDYDAVTGDLRVEVDAPSPCNTDITIYTLHR